MKNRALKKSVYAVLCTLMIILGSFTAFAGKVDFVQLRKQNPDIYAWLYIPGTDINYPVLQSSDDDAYYLYHSSDRKINSNGALFTERAYNNKGFTDPITVIYGHNMRSGKMFGFLEETYRKGFSGHDKAIVYMPNNTYEYRLFAALPVTSKHLLYGNNYYNKELYKMFLDGILKARTLEAVIDSSYKPKENGKLLVLSTCRSGGRTNERYIVVGELIK